MTDDSKAAQTPEWVTRHEHSARVDYAECAGDYRRLEREASALRAERDEAQLGIVRWWEQAGEQRLRAEKAEAENEALRKAWAEPPSEAMMCAGWKEQLTREIFTAMAAQRLAEIDAAVAKLRG